MKKTLLFVLIITFFVGCSLNQNTNSPIAEQTNDNALESNINNNNSTKKINEEPLEATLNEEIKNKLKLYRIQKD